MHWQHSNQTGGETITFELEISFRNVDNSLNRILLGRNGEIILSESAEEDESGDCYTVHSAKDRKFASKSALEETRTRLRSSLNPLSKASLRC